MQPAKKVKFDMIEQQNTEMANFLEQFPTEEPKIVWQTLVRMESDITAIRSQLERKPRKITLAQMDAKIDTIIKILLQNGLTYKEDVVEP